MRAKAPKKNEGFGVADGFDFKADSEEKEELHTTELTSNKTTISENMLIDPNRSYSKYYDPKPKTGSRGGVLGRGPVDAKDRKVQFSVTCTQEQKRIFADAAKKDKRKLPDFICLAIEEYIKNHNLD